MTNGKDSSRNRPGNSSSAQSPPAAPDSAKPAAAASVGARLEAAQKAKFARDFSQAVAVLMRDASYKNLRIADLEWLVIPPLIAGQCRVAISRYRSDGPIVPVAIALWARVSASVDKRLSENLDKPPLLRANEWTSGDNMWLITLAGEKQALASLLTELQKTAFKGRTVKLRAQTKAGATVVQSLTPPPAAD